MEKKLAIVQARLSSTRLQGKVLKKIVSKPLIKHVVDRLKRCNNIDQVVVATSKDSQDDLLVKWCEQNETPFFRGELEDVLCRFYECAREFNATHIVRVTSDNPLTDPAIVDRTIEHYLNNNLDYCSNNLEKSFPHGLDVEVLSFDSLEKSQKESSTKVHREHVTQYIRQNDEKFSISGIKCLKDLSHIRLTMDEDEDFQLIEIVMKLIGEDAELSQIEKLFEQYPALMNVNAGALNRHKDYNNGQGIC